MNYILSLFLFLIFFYLFLIIGTLLNKKLEVINLRNIIDTFILGYATFIILSFNSFFILKLPNIFLLCASAIFFLYYHISIVKSDTYNIIYLKKYFLFSSIFLLIFFIPIIFYGEQFYVFRGNYWDNFNYLSSALLFNNYSFLEVESLKYVKNFSNFQSIDLIINYRPFINYLLSIFLNIKIIDIFLINFLFKVFLSIINFLAFISFLTIFKNINEKRRILLSFVFSFSFFSLYIFEIEALSHLGSISLFLISIKYLYLLKLQTKKNLIKNSLYLSILSAALFIIYPEIFIIYMIVLFSYLIAEHPFFYLRKNIQNYLYFLLFFMLLTMSSYELNYKFVIQQVSQALRPNIDWWGYYGAFIIGRENLVLDYNYVETIKGSIVGISQIELIKTIYTDHLNAGYKWIYINILPSIFGLYYITPGKFVSVFSYIYLIFIIILNFYIILILCKNINFIFLKKKKFLYITTTLLIIFSCFLILNKNFWTVIKVYSYILPFLFLLMSINFRNQKINKIMIVLIAIFPIYKYSTNNNGIGKIDSMPSIINKDYKLNINWNLKQKDLDDCIYVFSTENDYFVRSYITIKTIYSNKYFQNEIELDNNNKNCNVSIVEKNFIVASKND